jgi:hypothetical protein
VRDAEKILLSHSLKEEVKCRPAGKYCQWRKKKKKKNKKKKKMIMMKKKRKKKKT